MANDKDFIVKNAVEVGGSVKTTVGTVTSGTTGYNIAGASYDSVSFSVASEETVPYKIRFNNDGTKLYVMGVVGDDINQYTLSTAFDLSTASYDSVSFSVASQETDPYGLAFNNDGTKMYITGNVSNSVFQYTLSTGFDLSTASYDSVSLNVNSQDTIPTGIIFNNTGSKLYMIGQSSGQIHQYTLTTDFNLSTASYDSVSFSIASEETSPMDMAFNSDGTKMYIVGSSSDTVFQYSLSTAYDISTASYDSVSFNVNTQDSGPRSLVFNNDGTKMYIIGTSTDSIYQYSTTLTTKTLDLSTGNYFNHTLTENTQFPLSNAGDVQSFQLEVTGGGAGYNFSNVNYDSKSFDVSSQETGVRGTFFKGDGTKFYTVGATDDTVYQYSLSTAWDISTASYDSKSFSVSSQDIFPGALAFKPDGTKMYIAGNTNDTIYQYSLSTAWDVSTASYDSKSFSDSNFGVFPNGLRFKPDGTKVYINNYSGSSVRQFSLSTAWDISTASYDSVSYTVGTQPIGLAFNDDGTGFLVILNNGAGIHQHDLSTAWDLSTASSPSVSFIPTEDIQPYSLIYGNSGKNLYIAGNDTSTIYQYSTIAGYTLTWPSSIEWAGGIAPSAPASGETDILTFSTDDGGTSYIGTKTADNLS